jgi:peptidoglycan/LPS O-acetylase OafA/YrhL
MVRFLSEKREGTMDRNALVTATVIGLVLQLAMVVGGHYSPVIKALFAVGGMGFSLIAGLVFAISRARRARGGWSPDLTGGALAGGICALVGIAVCVLLGDAPASLLLLGTISSVVTGAIGGAIGKLILG